MPNTEQIIVGLEVGTTKTCAVVAEVLADRHIAIIGAGQTPSRGVRKGEITNMDEAIEDIHQAVAEAEENADVEIHNVYASVTGGHLRCFDNRGSEVVTNSDRIITEAEVRRVMQNAKAINIPPDNVVIHAIRQRFLVDGHNDVENPVGMGGVRLEVDVHCIYGIKTRVQNTIRAIKSVPLDVADICVSSIATALAVTTTEEQQLGALVIDMGGGTTDYIVYQNGVVQHSGCLAVGGDHITNDIAVGLRVPVNRAEQLKREYGTALEVDRDEPILLKREIGLPDRELSRAMLCRVIHLRVAETLTIIRDDLERKKLLPTLGAGVFITGGCARLRGLEQLASEIFQLPVRIGHSQIINGPTSAIESPEYSTAIGLIRYGIAVQRNRPGTRGAASRLGATFQQILQRVRASFL